MLNGMTPVIVSDDQANKGGPIVFGKFRMRSEYVAIRQNPEWELAARCRNAPVTGVTFLFPPCLNEQSSE
jgi:hypothetical protein